MKRKLWLVPVVLASMVTGVGLDRAFFRGTFSTPPEPSAREDTASGAPKLEEAKTIAVQADHPEKLQPAKAAPARAPSRRTSAELGAAAVEALGIAKGKGQQEFYDADGALRWARTLPDLPTQQEDVSLGTVAVNWLKLDPPAARAWLGQSPLSPDSRERVLKPKKG